MSVNLLQGAQETGSMSIKLLQGFKEADTFEKYALVLVIVVALLGLVYAAFLARQILREPEGNDKMRHIARAIRTGGNAYLKRQFRTILLLIAVLAVFIFFTGYFSESTRNLDEVY